MAFFKTLRDFLFLTLVGVLLPFMFHGMTLYNVVVSFDTAIEKTPYFIGLFIGINFIAFGYGPWLRNAPSRIKGQNFLLLISSVMTLVGGLMITFRSDYSIIGSVGMIIAGSFTPINILDLCILQ